MAFKKMMTSVFNKFLQKKTWQTYSQRHYPHQHLKNWCTILECDDSENSSAILIRGVEILPLMNIDITVFFLLLCFSPLSFPSKIFNEAVINV